MMPPHIQSPLQKKHAAEDNRNLILACVLSALVWFGYVYFVLEPQRDAQRVAEAQRIEQQAAAEAAAATEQAARAERGEAPEAVNPFGAAALSKAEAVAASGPRIAIETPSLSGSIALSGGRIDELMLTAYRQQLAPDSPPIEMLWPVGTRVAYYPVFGWRASGGAGPTARTEWALAPGSADKLTPTTPVTLEWVNEVGLRFSRTIAVDDSYMFTITQTVENASGQSVTVKPFAVIRRQGELALHDQFSGESQQALAAAAGAGWLIHRGPIAVTDGALHEPEYDELAEGPALGPGRGRGLYYRVDRLGWLGFTDKYWMTALAPVERGQFEQYFETDTLPNGDPIYGATVERAERALAPGEKHSVQTYFFAGAKRVEVLRNYEYLIDGAAEPTSFAGKVYDFFFHQSESRFFDAIDWGWFFFLTKPITELLLAIDSVVGNLGIAIILLTVLFKLVLFPLAYKSYVSMSKLKKLQPQMKEIQERAGEDRMQMQQEIMALYKREKVNPAAGCLPILVQIPIFFSLYKVIFISLELRHEPFFGWIQDLSAPDPTSIFNLFGLLPFEPVSFLMIGIWPLIMGVTMWIQQTLNPAPTDPVQEKVFAFLPVLFTFMLAGFAAGLVIYWTANNLLTIIQQYSIMRSQGVDIDIFGNMKRQLGFGRDDKAAR